MKFVIKRLLLIFTLVICFLQTRVAWADWLDDWFEQYSASSPNYYETQKRGFITFGAFSARTGLGESLPLFTFEFPRIRGGCGGIDLFMGGFSFVNPEYLVQKLQNLIQAAPVVAFNLALKVLSASLSDEVKWVENVINLLNQLQFDECKFLQPLMIEEVKGSTITERLQYVKKRIIEGYEGLYDEAKKKIETASFDRAKKDEIVEDCPNIVREIYSVGSLLEWLGNRLGVPLYVIESIRAFTGDVVVSTQPDTTTFVYIRPIVTASDLKGHIERYQLVRMDKYGRRMAQDINFLNRLSSVLNSAYNAKINKQPVSNEYVKYAKVSPIPIEIVLDIAYQTRRSDFYAGMLPAIALGIYKEFMYSILSQGQLVLSRISDIPNDPNCSSMVATLREGMKEIDGKLLDYYTMLNSIYAQRLDEVEKSLDVALQVFEYRSYLRKLVAERLGSAVSSYLFGS